MNDIHPNDLRERIKTISHKMLDSVDAVLAALAPTPSQTRASVAVERRLVANSLSLWQFCATRTCQRARCCRGEPKQCLHYALPLLSPELLERLMQRRQRKGRSRRAADNRDLSGITAAP